MIAKGEAVDVFATRSDDDEVNTSDRRITTFKQVACRLEGSLIVKICRYVDDYLVVLDQVVAGDRNALLPMCHGFSLSVQAV